MYDYELLDAMDVALDLLIFNPSEVYSRAKSLLAIAANAAREPLFITHSGIAVILDEF